MFNRREGKKRKRFEKIYDSYVEQVFRFVYIKVSSKDDAEDITSKTFTRLWSSLQKEEEGREEVKNPRALLYKVARNLVIDHYRKNRPQREDREGVSPHKTGKPKKVPLDDAVIIDKDIRPDEKALINSQIEEVRSALQGINEDYQNVIIWYYLDELTTPEIAELLDKPEASVRVLIHRAVSALRKQLKEEV